MARLNPETERLIGTAAAARLLGVSEGRVRQMADRGTLPFTRMALGRLFDPEDVATVVAERDRRAVLTRAAGG